MSATSHKPRRLAVALALLAATSVIAGSAAAGKGSAGCTPDATWGRARQDLAPAVLRLVNAHRAQLGLGELTTSPTLTAAALWKARHMARYNYFSHDDPAPPVARTAVDRIHACGYGSPYVGENIADGFPTAAVVMQAWLASPGHRANIERSEFKAIGIGVASNTSSGRLYWVQDFGATVDAGAAATQRLLARRDVRAMRRNRPLVIRVLSNDRRPAGTRVTAIVQLPRHGAVTVNADQTVTYRPNARFVGVDHLRYAISDAAGETSAAAVVVRVRRR
jgi:uncharacterized protein YkwD